VGAADGGHRPLRQQLTGQRVWVFDPQQLAHTAQTMWWNPLAGVDSVEAAERLAGHFVAGVKTERDKIWSQAAGELLDGLLLAAALGGRHLGTVYGWLTNEHTDAPPQILEQHGFDEVAHSLRGFARLPHETRGSVFLTARAATACLRNPAIMGWVTPPASSDIEGFEPSSVIGTRQTVHLLSKDSGGSAAPLVAALIRAGIAGAEARGGRLDPRWQWCWTRPPRWHRSRICRCWCRMPGHGRSS
jgi:hypothetical protein